MESLLYMGQNIFIFEKCDKEIWLEEALIPDTGLDSTEIWFRKDFKLRGVGRWKQSLAGKKAPLSHSLSSSIFLSASLPPSCLCISKAQLVAVFG